MILFAEQGFASIVIHIPCTDVLIIALSASMKIHANIFLKTGIKNKARIINLTVLQQQLKIHLPASSNKTVSKICEALVSLHAITGCDSVSAVAGKGKVGPFRTMCTNDNYINSFQQLGSSWTVSDDLLLRIEKVVCLMYGFKQPNLVNNLRYKMHCSKYAKIFFHQAKIHFTNIYW